MQVNESYIIFQPCLQHRSMDDNVLCKSVNKLLVKIEISQQLLNLLLCIDIQGSIRIIQMTGRGDSLICNQSNCNHRFTLRFYNFNAEVDNTLKSS